MSRNNISIVSPILTIGYATYNRKGIVIKRFIEALEIDLSNEVEIIFIDNASEDGTYDELQKLNVNDSISIYRNNNNLGFSGNFIQVLKKANGKYAIWVSDEDSIEVLKIKELTEYLKKHNPDSLVLNHFKKINNKLYPIRLNTTKLLKETDLWATCHLPGNIWKRESVKVIYKSWNDYVEMYPQLSKFYPNLIFMILLIPNKKSYFYNNFLTYQKDFIKSSHVTSLGNSYPNVVPRWLQHNEILKLISNSINEKANHSYNISLLKIKENLNKNIFVLISNAIYEENKEIYYHFARSSFPSYILRRNFHFLSIAIKFIIRNPVSSYAIILKRLRAFYKSK